MIFRDNVITRDPSRWRNHMITIVTLVITVFTFATMVSIFTFVAMVTVVNLETIITSVP